MKKPEMKFRNELILFFFLLVAIPTIDLLIFRATENLYVAVAVLASLLVFLVFGLLNMDRICLLYTSPSPRDLSTSRMPSSA